MKRLLLILSLSLLAFVSSGQTSAVLTEDLGKSSSGQKSDRTEEVAVVGDGQVPAEPGLSQNLSPGGTEPAGAAVQEEEIDLPEIIFGHVGDAYEWHILDWGKDRKVELYLPVIVRSKYSGWHVFSSKKLEGEGYEGFYMGPEGSAHERKVVERAPDGSEYRPLDLSITKNVLSLIMSGILLLVVILATARWYRKHDSLNEAPSGIAAFMEPVVMMIHDMARENIGEEDYRKYSPYLIMAFLFIILNNFLGIIPFFPGGANLTGNIACTMVLALFTFIIVNATGSKHYYKEIFAPDVPSFLIPIMPVIEVFSAMMKPVSLTIRLFANMLAGHIQILCVVCLIFIMAKYGAVLTGSMGLVSLFFGIFLDCLELLISFIQAYVFTMLSSIYIGLARQKS